LDSRRKAILSIEDSYSLDVKHFVNFLDSRIVERKDMSEQRRKYTKEFKIKVVHLFENSEKSGREIKQDLDIGTP